MPKRKPKNVMGVGECGNPKCSEPRAEGRYVCGQHGQELDEIRKDFEENPNLLHKQRSDNPNRVFLKSKFSADKSKLTTTSGRKRPTAPTCCRIGCYESRIPPSPFCFVHEADDAYDD